MKLGYISYIRDKWVMETMTAVAGVGHHQNNKTKSETVLPSHLRAAPAHK